MEKRKAIRLLEFVTMSFFNNDMSGNNGMSGIGSLGHLDNAGNDSGDTGRLSAEFSEIVRSGISSALEEERQKISENFIKVLEQQETIIRKQHETIARFQEDLIFKLQKPLIMELIGIADNIRMILQDQKEEQNYDLLLESVEDLEKWVDAVLSNNSVNMFRETDVSASELNRKRQEIIDVEETDDPGKNNTYISERPGYEWSMPYLVVNSDVQLEKILQENDRPGMFAYVIRPEEVVKLKYKKGND